MNMKLLLLALVGSAMGMVCPPRSTEELKANLKAEGEACGGACDSQGWCADGLECVVPKASPMSFAILLTPARIGVCRGLVEETEEDVKVPTMGGTIPGGVTRAEVDEAMTAAANFCVTDMNSASNALTPPTMVKIVEATKQVVAGIKYHLKVEMSDGHQHEFDVLEQAWMTPRYQILERKFNVEQ